MRTVAINCLQAYLFWFQYGYIHFAQHCELARASQDIKAVWGDRWDEEALQNAGCGAFSSIGQA